MIAPDVGGGFGQKMSLPPEYVLLVWLARKLRTSVAWIEDRRENLIAGFHSRDQAISLEGAFDGNGKLLALSADVVANVGAYSCYPTTCGVEPLMAMAEMPGPYDVRGYSCVARGVLTNTCPMAPYRGVSRPVITFALERLMDKAALALRPRPVEIRRRNLIAQVSLHVGDRSRLRRGQLSRDAGDRGEGRSMSRRFARASRRRGPKAAFSASALRPSPSAPAMARRLSRRAAWRSRPAGKRSSWRWTRRASSRRASARRRTARACARRSAQIIADELGVTAGPHTHRARRYRPHALRLRHLREPLAGHCRRRHAARRAQGEGRSCSRSRATCSKRRRTTSCWQDGKATVAGTDRSDSDRSAGARGLSSDASLQGPRPRNSRERHL